MLGSEHPDVIAIMENYADILRKINRIGEAEEIEAHVRKIRTGQTGDA